MKLHPVISIIIGFTVASVAVICIFILSVSAFQVNILNSDIDAYNWFLVGSLFALLLGGFITTYFTKEKKRRYSVYTGLLLTVAFFVLSILAKIYDIHNTGFILMTIFLFILVPLITGAGGCLGGFFGRKNQKEPITGT